jgi:hypothetical protein
VNDREALERRMLRPERPRLALARAAVEGLTNPREAWEALATRGLIPDAWVADPSRVFRVARRCACCRGARRVWSGEGEFATSAECGACSARGVWFADAPQPATVAACVALAGDAAGLATAEALAREFVARAAPRLPAAERVVRESAAGPRAAVPWAAFTSSPARTVWQLGGPFSRPPRPHPGALLAQAAALALSGRPRAAHEDLPWPGGRLSGAPDSAASALADDLTAACWYWVSVREGVALPEWRALRDLADPFDPLLEIWRMGYALDAVSHEAFALIAPEAAP